jgi:hypothetical protein
MKVFPKVPNTRLYIKQKKLNKKVIKVLHIIVRHYVIQHANLFVTWFF